MLFLSISTGKPSPFLYTPANVPFRKEKPFYKIFIEVTADKLGLDIPGVVQKTGLTDKQVRTIITRQMKVAPLDLAMQLSDTLNVPLEVWLGIENYAPAVQEIYQLYSEGKTITEIVKHLNDKGLRTARGRPFTHNSLRTVLKYIGT